MVRGTCMLTHECWEHRQFSGLSWVHSPCELANVLWFFGNGISSTNSKHIYSKFSFGFRYFCFSVCSRKSDKFSVCRDHLRCPTHIWYIHLHRQIHIDMRLAVDVLISLQAFFHSPTAKNVTFALGRCNKLYNPCLFTRMIEWILWDMHMTRLSSISWIKHIFGAF